MKIDFKNLLAKIRSKLTPRVLRNWGILFALILFLYLLMDFLVMPLYTRHWQKIIVPNVTHLSYEAAEKILARVGLKAVKAAEKYDENFPPGFVLFQNPEAESPVKKGRRVYLTVGKGQRVFPMPNFIGEPFRDVKFRLKELKLRLGKIEYEIDEFHPEGGVSDQSIEPKTQVSVGEVVDLTVSLGAKPDRYIVPDLIGKSEDDAKIAIKKAGLTLGEITYQETDRLVPKTVISQSLEAGLEVMQGDTLNIVVSQLPGSDKEKIQW